MATIEITQQNLTRLSRQRYRIPRFLGRLVRSLQAVRSRLRGSLREVQRYRLRQGGYRGSESAGTGRRHYLHSHQLWGFPRGILVFSQPGALNESQFEQVITSIRELDMDKVREENGNCRAELAISS